MKDFIINSGLNIYINNIKETDDTIIIHLNQNANYKVNMKIKNQLSHLNKKIEFIIDSTNLINNKVISFMSGKGGVGKSYITTLFAKAYATKKILILDLDIYGYSIPKILNLYNNPEIIDNKIIPVKYNDYIDVMSSQYFIKDLENKAIIWRGPKLKRLMDYMIRGIDMQKYDLILIDTPPNTGDIILNLKEYFENINYYIITTPRMVDQHVCIRTKEVADELLYNSLGFIINESFYTHNNEKIFLFGDDFNQEIASDIILKLEINNDEHNLQLIKELLKKD